MVYETVLARATEWAAQGSQPDLFGAVSRLGLLHVLHIGYGLDPGQPVVDELGRELMAYKQATMTADPRRRTDLPALTVAKVLDVPHLFRAVADLRRRVKRLRALVKRLPESCPARLGDAESWLERLSPVLPHAQLTNELNHLYGAYSAIDYVITAGLLELSRHPEWRARLGAERRSQLGEAGFSGRADFRACR